MHSFAQIPEPVRRGRDSRQTDVVDDNIAEEIRHRDEILRTVSKYLKACYHEVEQSLIKEGQLAVHLHAS